MLTLSASVTGLKGAAGLEFSGSIQGIQIDVGKLLDGEFPIVGLDSLSVSIKGNLFGGEIDGDADRRHPQARRRLPADRATSTRPRRSRTAIFFVGIEGGFTIAGMAGFTIRLALSELGPLTVLISASLPTGILLEPQHRPLDQRLRRPASSSSRRCRRSTTRSRCAARPSSSRRSIPADEWLATVKAQVVQQALRSPRTRRMSGFAAAFTAPMTITGSAKIYSIYTSQQVFNGQIIVKISTDGKILVVGKLNFAADNLSVSGRLYADLSHVATGNVTVLFLADIPDQVRVLTLYGRLQMGFRDASGQEVAFVAVDSAPLIPTASLAGPRDGRQDRLRRDQRPRLHRRHLQRPERVRPRQRVGGRPRAGVRRDGRRHARSRSTRRRRRSSSSGTTYRYWLAGPVVAPTGTVTLTPITSASGNAAWGMSNVQTGVVVGNTAAANQLTVVQSQLEARYVDVLLAPTAGKEVTEGSVAGTDLKLILANGQRVDALNIAPTRIPGSNVFRFYLPNDLDVGVVALAMDAGAWTDSAGNQSAAFAGSFTVQRPSADLSVPSTVDVGAINGDKDGTVSTFPHFIDVTFNPIGSGLDYASIFDTDPEISLTMNGGTAIALGRPIPIELTPDPTTGVLRGSIFVTKVSNGVDDDGDGAIDEADELTQDDIDAMRTAGIFRFRYRLPAGRNWEIGSATVTVLPNSWSDERGTFGPATTSIITVNGPTGLAANPAAGAGLDINLLNQRNWIDVTLPVATGWALDPGSISDADDEFSLSGPGLGSVTLDPGQRPLVTDAALGKVRIFVTGVFGAGDVTVNFKAGSWGYKPTGGGDPNAPAATLAPVTVSGLGATNNRTYIDVTYTATAGGTVNPQSIVDADQEFSLAGAGANVTSGTDPPIEVATELDGYRRTFRYFLTGDFTRGQVTIHFNPNSFSTATVSGSLVAVTGSLDPTTLNLRNWLDVKLAAAPATTLANSQFVLGGAGLGTITLDPAATPILVDATQNIVRLTLKGTFTTGAVTVTYNGANTTLPSPATNDHAYLDVTYLAPAGGTLDEASILDSAPEFSLSGAFSGLGLAGAPVSLGNGRYRYFVTGTVATGQPAISFLAGGVTATGATGTVVGALEDLSASNTLNSRKYVDVIFTAALGGTVDTTSITDAGAEFTLGGAAAGMAISGTPTLQLSEQGGAKVTYRYALTGTWGFGAVTITFLPGTAAATGAASYSNLAADQTFTVLGPTGTIIGPGGGSQTGANALNQRGYIDVGISVDEALQILDPSTVTDLAPEFTLGGPGAAGVTLDATQAPLYLRTVGSTMFFRYWTKGTYTSGT